MRVALCRLNPTVGDLRANAALHLDAAIQARAAGAHLLVAPELGVSGYPPKDLLLQDRFVDEAMEVSRALASEIHAAAPGLTAIVGTPWKDDHGVRNALLVMRDGAAIDIYFKQLLPTYDVFDEDRYFTEGVDDPPCVIEVGGLRVGLTICEDLWRGADAGALARYRNRPDPVARLVGAGVDLIVNPSASPFVLGKAQAQRAILAGHCAAHRVALAGVNQLGGNDDLVFDGHAIAFVPCDSAGARLVASGERFRDELVCFDIPAKPGGAGGAGGAVDWSAVPSANDALDGVAPERLLFECLAMGVRDYCRKTGFTSAVLGVSGGIDSAVTACIAAAALGADKVLALAMPSRYSSGGSVTDARALCDALGLRMIEFPIGAAHDLFERDLAPRFDELGLDPEPGVTEENIQSRLRGVTLMAFSNKTGAMLLTTGNKSELAVGYCTLYGDMNGGLAVLSDVTKAWVYRLARFINERHQECGFETPPIPEASITKPPSAELKPGQTDQDSLPPYDVVDSVVEMYVERRMHPREIVRATGFDPEHVARVVRLTDLNEYKRKQAAIGIKVSGVAFGSGRRMPNAQAWRPDRNM